MVDQASNTIASFRALQGNQARAQFLQELIPELSPYERRDLKEVLNQETNQHDIISSLPLELVNNVLQYLDVSELFSLRRVSRGWLRRLASHDVCRAILRHDFPEEKTLVDSNDLDPTTRLFSKARQRHAFRTGRPYSKASFPIKLHFDQVPPETRTPICLLDYHDGKLVWVDHSSGTDIARTLNLTNGREFSFVPTNRELISQVKISDTLVAVITSLGICHVFDHRTEEGHFFRLPSLSTARMSVAARRLTVVGSPAEAGFASVLLRNFDTQKSSILQVSLGSDSYAQSIVLHPCEDAFYLITTGRPRQPYDEEARSFVAKVEFLKFNFQGQMTFKRECWAKSQWVFDHWNWGFGPTVNGSHYTMALGTKYIGLDCRIKTTRVYEDHYIDYDMESEKVVYEKLTRRLSEAASGSRQSERSGPLRQNMRWKDVNYFGWYQERRLESILVQNVRDSASAWKTEMLEIDSIANSEKRSARIMLHGDYVGDHWLVGDERFLVMMSFDEVQVWCFEKDLVMPGEEPHYRAERAREADLRTLARTVLL